MGEILTDEGWREFDPDTPRCPYCNGEAVITETDTYAAEEMSDERRADQAAGRFVYGWIAVYCAEHPDEHLDATLDYRSRPEYPRPDYCTRPGIPCDECSLVSYGRDCRNAPIARREGA